MELKLRNGTPKLGIRLKALQARDEIKVHAERVMDGLKPKRRGARRNEPLTAAVPAKVRHRPPGRH